MKPKIGKNPRFEEASLKTVLTRQTEIEAITKVWTMKSSAWVVSWRCVPSYLTGLDKSGLVRISGPMWPLHNVIGHFLYSPQYVFQIGFSWSSCLSWVYWEHTCPKYDRKLAAGVETLTLHWNYLHSEVVLCKSHTHWNICFVISFHVQSVPTVTLRKYMLLSSVFEL